MSFGGSYPNKAREKGGEGDFGLFFTPPPPPEYPPANMVPFPYRDAI